MSKFHDDIADRIERFGRTVIGVFPAEDSKDTVNDAFAYSIGNRTRGLPEVLVVGMCDRHAQWLVNAVSDEMARGFEGGDLSLGGRCCVHVLPASEAAKDTYTFQATQWHGSKALYDLVQVVVPDKNGRFPWDADCKEPFSRVRVYRREQH